MPDYSVVDEETNENDILIDIELDKKCKCKRKYIVTIMLSLIILVIISIIYVNYSIDIRIYDVESTDVEARFHSGIHHYHHTTCKDLDYGCCSIIDNLNHNHTLSLHRIQKRDLTGTNCPSFNNLIDNYESYIQKYPSYFNTVNCSKTECCKYGEKTLSIYKYCPTTFQIILAYEINYYDPWNDDYILLIVMCFIICLFAGSGSKSKRMSSGI